jgi:starch phosphorylase
LIFTDPDRLAKIVEGGRPVQFVFAGKAHPRDVHGKEIVERVLRWSDAYRFRNRVAFVEDYDIHTGRLLTSGSDVWLNNPRRPNEASGTSGQKGPFNGGLNFSTLDGWWPEAYDDTNGWAIGDGREDTETIDDVDVESMYRLLEEEIVPLWSARDAHGIPAGWLARVRRSVRTCAPVFNSHRMVRDYVHRMYRSPSTT